VAGAGWEVMRAIAFAFSFLFGVVVGMLSFAYIRYEVSRQLLEIVKEESATKGTP
jgi:hypothetical protein